MSGLMLVRVEDVRVLLACAHRETQDVLGRMERGEPVWIDEANRAQCVVGAFERVARELPRSPARSATAGG
ncbi:MAG: hypothetical protein FJ087_08015 [Deltaproteobacteria bacterium]|nr:hypothetical protein [Deltaproteobacteria bacterium]